MNIKDIPLIILNYNQLSYLKNLINQFSFYYPENPIYVIDNASDYWELIRYYEQSQYHSDSEKYHAHYQDAELNLFTVLRYRENTAAENLKHFLETKNFEYYLISDPDISIHLTTPPFFLEVFKELIDAGYHHAGFDLIYDDLPEWNKKAAWIAGDEKNLHNHPVEVKFNDYIFTGFHAAIDTTFALYSSKNGGWSAPMPGKDWGNSVRIFKAHHSTWYLHPEYLNEEMTNYFNTCRRHDGGVSAGKNNHSPFN